MTVAQTVTLRDDPYIDWKIGIMEFTLTYIGKLLAFTTDQNRAPGRALHVHDIRREFHEQLKRSWNTHPVLAARAAQSPDHIEAFEHDGFNWIPLATKSNGLICKLDMTMLRSGDPGDVLTDIDNRLKTIFDALKKPDGPRELGSGSSGGQATPQNGEDPFYVLLQDDSLITHISVTTDNLLEDVQGVPRENAVRLIMHVTVRPYHVHMDNLDFT